MSTHVTDHAGNASGTQIWKWTADAYSEMSHLNRFGDQGWEVERVDGLARFVSRRPASGARRWEYHRETVLFGGGTPADELAAEGWEPCGNWACFEYYKRPGVAWPAGLGPLPAVPSRHVYWSRRIYLFIVTWAISVAFLAYLAMS